MSRLAAHRWVCSLPLVVLLAGPQAKAQDAFDFETFGRHIQEARARYEAAEALGDEDPELRRELLIESSEVQQRAIDMLSQALEAGVFAGADREEATARLLELNVSVIVLMVETGRCSAAATKLGQTLADSHLLPEQGEDELLSLRPSVRDCVEAVTETEEPSVEPEEPSIEPGEPAPEPTQVAEVEAAADEPVEGPGGSAAPDVVIEERDDGADPLATTAWITGSVGVACLATALGFYLNTRSLQDELDTEVARPRFDPERAEGLWSDIERSDDLMNVFLWSGVALAAGTAILVTLAVLDDDEARMVAPAAIPGGALVGIGWRF